MEFLNQILEELWPQRRTHNRTFLRVKFVLDQKTDEGGRSSVIVRSRDEVRVRETGILGCGIQGCINPALV